MSNVVQVNLQASNADLKEENAVELVEPKRDQWGHKAEFILASVGLAVGLGNIWRFPYLCQKNGGGAFLIPYVIMMIIEGIPLFFIEFSIGQRFRKSALQAWDQVSPSMFGIGVSCLVVSFMLCVYYVIVLSWCFYYFFMSFTSNLPWAKKNCVNFEPYNAIVKNITYFKNTNATLYASDIKRLENGRDTYPDCCVHDTPMWYWYHKTLKISTGIEDSGIGINGTLCGCLAIAWIVTYLCVVKGIKSSGKVVYFTAVFPYVVLIILFFRGITLDGADIGIKAFFNPDFQLLKNPKIWMDAATQMFFTLSLGFGALIAFSSYMPERNNCIRDAYLVVFVNCGTSLFAGIVVFTILGYREKTTGIPATQVGSGPGMAFMTFSDALLLMDVSPLWSVLFFFMLILLGIDSEFGTLEAAIAPLYDMNLMPKKLKKEYFTGICAIAMFLVGLCMVSGPGFYIFQIFDDYSVTLPLLLIALFQVVAVSWVYGNDNFANDIEYMTGSRPNAFWLICWKYISPLALIIVFIAAVTSTAANTATYTAYVGCIQDPFSSAHNGTKTWTESRVYPGWAQFIIVIVILASTLPLVFWMFLDLYRRPQVWKAGFHKRFCTGWTEYLPDPSWGDASRRKSPEEIEVEMRALKKAQALEQHQAENKL